MTCKLCNDTGEQRYWEGRWRDEKAENERLRAALKPFADEVDLIGLHGNAPPPERFLMFASDGGGTFLGISMKALYDAASSYQQREPEEG